MHLGHYVGSIQNRVQLQQEYETYLLVADLHMLTTRNTKEDIDAISENARGMVL
ncbi:MAG: tryptophan--tRNA ligase, partial [Planctomycetota bacterium]